jgi:hypothetical protein
VAFLRSDNFFSSPWRSQHFMEFELLFPGSCSYPEADCVEPWSPTFFCFRYLFHLFLGLPCRLFPWGFPRKSRRSIEYIWGVYLSWSYSFFMICQNYRLRPISPQCFFISLQWILKWLKIFSSKLKLNITCAVESTGTWIRLFVQQIAGTQNKQPILHRNPSEYWAV